MYTPEGVKDTMVHHQTMSFPSRIHSGALTEQNSVERMLCRRVENREKQRHSRRIDPSRSHLLLELDDTYKGACFAGG